MNEPHNDSLNDFWEDAEPGDWEFESEVQSEDDDALISRRQAMGGAASILGVAIAGSLNLLWGSSVASADVASGGLSISGDSATSDGGNLQSLTVSTSGHVSYDGLDTDAADININFFAAHSGNSVDTAANQIDSQTVTVGSTTGLKTRAGHYDYAFSGVNVFNSDDLKKSDFKVNSDGDTQSFDIDFRIELEVLDSAGTKLVEGASKATTTISITNQARSTGANGNGNTTAKGNNQSA